MTKGFQPGFSGNPAGRKPGTKNKTTEEIRGLIQQFVEDNWPKIQEDFDKLKPPDRLKFLDSMIKHFLPVPLNPEKLSDAQLEELYQYFKMKIEQEKKQLAERN